MIPNTINEMFEADKAEEQLKLQTFEEEVEDEK